MEEEVDKVRTLNPARYLIATSVSLTPSRKAKIRALFGDYIASDEDILGKENLNNLLSLYQFLVSKMQSLLSFSYLDYNERQAFVSLFERLHSFLDYDENELAYNFSRSLTYLSDWFALAKLNKVIPDGVSHFKSDTKLFNERYIMAVNNEKRNDNVGFRRSVHEVLPY